MDAPLGFERRVGYVKAPGRDQIADTGAVSAVVADVLDQVRRDGDAAVRRFSETFDRATLDSFEVSAVERRAAVEALAPQTRADTEFAIENVRRFALLSAPVMSIVPGKVAGCDEVVACLPPNADPAMIAGCHLSGADPERVGGA